MAWRVAKSLNVLLDQINRRYPGRNKASDGSIGDAAHASRDSDHNPWVRDGSMGVVTARDFTHDPANGVDIDRLTDELQASKDSRIKYVIANNLIMSGNGGPSPWKWRSYRGPNPHTRHFHISVHSNKSLYDDTRQWNLPSLRTGGGAAPGTPTREDDDMTLEEFKKALKEDAELIELMHGVVWGMRLVPLHKDRESGQLEWPETALFSIRDRLEKEQFGPIRKMLEKIGTGNVDTDELAIKVARELLRQLAE